MRILTCLALILVLVISSCKKTYPTTIINTDTTIIIRTDTTIIQDTSVGNKQVRLKLPEILVYDTSYQFTDVSSNIQKFNIDYYTNADSAVYSFLSEIQPGNTGTVELYNFTDSVAIPNSLITVTKSQYGYFYQSANVFKSLPHKEITLGLRLKGTVQGNYFNSTSGYLYIYKK